MRDFKGMKRQRGRNRGGGGGGNGNNGGGGGKPTHNVNRAFDSNGPDNVKIRGHAQHVYEKYQQLARDATLSGDRVLAENYLQHAEHYFRLIRSIQPQRPASEIVGRDVFASGYDIDFEDESGAQEAASVEEAESAPDGDAQPSNGEIRQDRFENRPEPRQDQQRFENRGDYRRDDRPERNDRSDRQNDRPDRQEQRFENRDNRQEPRGEGRSDQQRFEPRNSNRRDERPRFEGRRDDRPREDRFEAAPRDPMPVVEPRATPLTAEPAEPAEASQVLRSQDGGVSHAPAFLQGPAAAPPAAEDGEVRRPRGRPRRKPAAESEAPATAEEV